MLTNLGRRIGAAAAGALVAFAIAGCGAGSERELVASARSYLAKNDQKAAIIQLKTALQKSPKSAEVRFLLGQALLKAGDPAAAAVELEKAHDLRHPDDEVLPPLARALMNTGQAKKVTDLYSRVVLDNAKAGAELKAVVSAAFGAQGDLERSEAANNVALRLDPGNSTARLLQARLIAGRGDIDGSLTLAQKLIADDPQLREASQLRCELLWYGKQDAAGAMQACRDTLAVDPAYLPAHSLIIGLQLKNRDIDGYKAQLAQLRKVLPNHPETKFYEVQAALIDKDEKRAREGVQQLLRYAGDDPRVLQLAGAVDFQSGALLTAESYLNKALLQSPNMPLARRLLAETYLRSGQPAKALTALQPLLEQDAPAGEVLSLAAEAQLQNGDAAKSEALFTQASKADPADPKVRAALALTQLARGNTDAGFAQLESLASTDKSSYADLVLISARLRRNDTAAALQAADRLLAKMPDKPLPHLLRGRILVQRKDLPAARVSFERALATDAAYFPAVANLAALDIDEKKPDDARKRFEAVLAREPKNYRALLSLAEMRQRAGAAPAEIRTLLTNAVRQNPAEPIPRLMLVEHLLAQRDAKAAREAAQDAVAAVPNDMPLLDALGRTQLAAGDVQQAISAFRKVVAAQPNTVLPLLRLADAYMANKDRAAAAESLTRALTITPNLLAAQQGLVRIDLADKQYAQALQRAQAVQTQRPGEAAGYLLEADVQLAQKRWDAAVAALQTGLDRSRGADVAARLHAVYTSAGRASDAARFAATWQREHPQDLVFAAHLGFVALEQKDYARAEARFREITAVRKDDAVALNNIAWSMLQQGKRGALEYAERAVALSADQPYFLDTLAAAQAADNQLTTAIATQRKALALAPGNPTFHFDLAKLLLRAGDKEAARAELLALDKLGSNYSNQAEVQTMLKTP